MDTFSGPSSSESSSSESENSSESGSESESEAETRPEAPPSRPASPGYQGTEASPSPVGDFMFYLARMAFSSYIVEQITFCRLSQNSNIRL